MAELMGKKIYRITKEKYTQRSIKYDKKKLKLKKKTHAEEEQQQDEYQNRIYAECVGR